MKPSENPFRSSKANFNPVAESVGTISRQNPDTLQDKMILDDDELKRRRESSRAEMVSRLPPLPHEIEIKAELKDEEELLRLYQELEDKKKETAEKRREIGLKKIEKIEKEKHEKLERLKYFSSD